MIQLKPIDSAVQKTLIEKIKQSGKKERPVNEPLSGNKGNYMQTRTTWARMISLSVPKGAPNEPIVISAGEEIVSVNALTPGQVNETETVETTKLDKVTNILNPMREVVNSKSVKINGQIRGDFQDVYQTDNYNRPIAGLKSISTRIQGQTKAVKSVDVNWTCWDFETIERLTPYFLSPGASVAVEFGWMWPGHTPNEFIYDNWIKLDTRMIGDLSKVVKRIGKGHQELVYGIVKNFSWTGRDDGGFDCVTQLYSPAANVFSSQLGDSEEAPSFEIPADIRNQIRDERKLLKQRSDEVLQIRENEEIQKALKKEGLGSLEEDDPAIKSIPPKILFENFKEILLNMKYNYEDGGVLEAGGEAGWGNSIESENEEFKDTILVEKVPFNLNSNIDERYLGPYITYGWFEDNILSRFITKIHKENKIGYQIRSVDYVGQDKDGTFMYESVKINNDSANLLTLKAKEVIIPGQWPMDLDFATQEISGMSAPPSLGEDFQKYSFTRQSYIQLMNKVRELPTFNVEPTVKLDPVKGESALGADVQFRKLRRRSEAAKAKILDTDAFPDGFAPPQGKGYLRNLLINAQIVEEEMGSANTIEDGLMNLMKRISSACGNIWDFKLTTDPDNEFQLKVIEDSSTAHPVRNLLNNKSLDTNTGEVADGYVDDKGNIPNPGLMVFPAWQTNSIVYNQSMVTKIPSQMASAAVYGRNMEAGEAAAEDLTLEPAAKAIGKLFNAGMEDPQNPRDILLDKMKRVLGNDAYENWGYNSHPKGNVIPGLNAETNYPNNIRGIKLDVDEIIQIYTEKQIMAILEDGVPVVDEEGNPEPGIIKKAWNFYVSVNPALLLAKGAAVISKKLGGALATWWEDGLDFRYLYTNSGEMKKHFKSALIYFLKQSPSSLQRTKDQITPIELSVTIDGTGGISAGESFSSSYIPKRYREACVFQIMDVSHQLDSAGWKTTLKGLMRIDYGFGAKKPIVDTLRDLIKEQTTITPDNPNDPPYLNFSDYLTKTKGRKKPFKTEPPKKAEKVGKDKQKETQSKLEAEAKKKS